MYENNQLQFILTSEGRIMMQNNGTYEYQYFLKDHLGNTRITLSQNGNILQEDAYYPFGMNIAGLSYSDASPENRYKYNGKRCTERSRSELEGEFGLDWYDYGARFYDAILGRWHVRDPLAEEEYQWTSYNYTFNRPIKFVDPDGRYPFLPIRMMTGMAMGIAKVVSATRSLLAGGNVSKDIPSNVNISHRDKKMISLTKISKDLGDIGDGTKQIKDAIANETGNTLIEGGCHIQELGIAGAPFTAGASTGLTVVGAGVQALGEGIIAGNEAVNGNYEPAIDMATDKALDMVTQNTIKKLNVTDEVKNLLTQEADHLNTIHKLTEKSEKNDEK